MSLSEQQRAFCLNVGKLIIWAYDNGYEFTFGEALRTPEQAAHNATTGAGIANSLHLIKLAIDLNLFKDGVYQTDSAAYKPIGDYWKSLDPINAWGGDFSKPDGNHFSSSYGGTK
jgi:D-alanyl-D-alanine carboxypeptidase